MFPSCGLWTACMPAAEGHNKGHANCDARYVSLGSMRSELFCELTMRCTASFNGNMPSWGLLPGCCAAVAWALACCLRRTPRGGVQHEMRWGPKLKSTADKKCALFGNPCMCEAIRSARKLALVSGEPGRRWHIMRWRLSCSRSMCRRICERRARQQWQQALCCSPPVTHPERCVATAKCLGISLDMSSTTSKRERRLVCDGRIPH